MLQESYILITEPKKLYYRFISEGPKGKIKKGIIYQQISETSLLFNLAFGDMVDGTDELDDQSISNNSDRQKVLTTVAKSLVDFLENQPYAKVVATGSTKARTRLYRMGISLFWDEINKDYEVKGYLNKDWHPFEKGINFESYSIKRKIFK